MGRYHSQHEIIITRYIEEAKGGKTIHHNSLPAFVRKLKRLADPNF